MAEVRETQVTRDMEGNELDRKTVIERPKKKGGFGWGLFLGVLIVAGAIVAFAYNQGSFQTAGVRADQALQRAEPDLYVAMPAATAERDVLRYEHDAVYRPDLFA